MSIPLRASFIWLGAAFPWANVLALRSAAVRGGFDEVVLHHDSDLSGTPFYDELVSTPGVRLQRLDLDALLARCAPYTAELRSVWGRLVTPTTRSDLLRYAILYADGGVYLDIDTITVKSFASLCANATAFCGEERIVYPAVVRRSRDPVVKIAAFARDRARDACRRLPRGYRAFRHIEHLYPRAANQAILGSEPGSAFLRDLLERMFRIPPDRQPILCAIGTHLLQELVGAGPRDDLTVHAPAVFFPLGPEISEHWFRTVDASDVSDVLAPETVLVHWYASVRTKHLVPHIDHAYVREHAATQLFSALALPYV
jgi:hypothetical protein